MEDLFTILIKNQTKQSEGPTMKPQNIWYSTIQYNAEEGSLINLKTHIVEPSFLWV